MGFVGLRLPRDGGGLPSRVGGIFSGAVLGVIGTCNLVVFVAFYRLSLNFAVLDTTKVVDGGCVCLVTLTVYVFSVLPITNSNNVLVP